ncbi:MAG: lipase family protein [Gammaproteobacteria bacterium]|nr:lipase family protein [Gammaproteobacteria bacterium]
MLAACQLILSPTDLYARSNDDNTAASNGSTYTETSTQQFNHTDFSHWLDAAYIADASYKSREVIEAVLESQGYKLQQYKQLDGFSVSYIIAVNDEKKQYIIAVRGTSNVDNVIVDAAFVLVPDKLTGIDIHQGFLLSARDIYQQLLPELKPGYKITTIGHSLGGADALILAMMLDAKGYTIDEVITFGQPKVTNIGGSNKYEHLNIKRLVNPKDVVPLVPPADPMDMMNLSIFWHQGNEIILYGDNKYAVLSGVKSMLRATDFLDDIPSEQNLNNHFMTTYISNIKPKLNGAKEIEYKSNFSFSNWFGSSPSRKP